MKAKRYIVSVIDCDYDDYDVIANAIYDALEHVSHDYFVTAFNGCRFMVSPYNKAK